MSETNKTSIGSVVSTILIILVLVASGFFLGRCTVKEKVKIETEYVQLPPIHDTVPKPVPVAVKAPVDTADIIKDCVKKGIYTELFPEKIITDTMVITKEDTTAALIDWATARYYNETLFDIDTVGKCVITEKLQYNRIDTLGYIFTPIQKTITKEYTKVKLFSPFVGAGWQSSVGNGMKNQAVKAEVGFFIKEKVGLSVDYQFDYMQNTHSLGGELLYKF
jgi:hypothetical protein